MIPNIWTLLGIMMFAGAFGGLVNYFIERRDSPEKSSILRSLVVGVGASFLVPLFLNMISSDLMRQLDQDAGKLLVFVGFCLIAAITSSAFIRSLSDKILKEASEAKRLSKELNDAMMPILLRETEAASEEVKLKIANGAESLDPETSEVLFALASGRYAWRTVDGLHHQTGLDRAVIETHLQSLIQGGYVVCREDAQGIKRWAITAAGRKAWVEVEAR
jgi:DNA-binding MarR family transcriptional regulator